MNADGYVSTGTGILGLNMFAYCNNNPVNMIDTNGNMPTGLCQGRGTPKKDPVRPIIKIESNKTSTINNSSVDISNPVFSIKSGVKTTTTTYNNGYKSKIGSVYMDTEANAKTKDITISAGVKNKLYNTEINISANEFRYSKGNGYGGNTTVFFTTDYHVGYEYSYTISWDNSETSIYFSESINLPIVAAGALAYYYGPAGIVVAVPSLVRNR